MKTAKRTTESNPERARAKKKTYVNGKKAVMAVKQPLRLTQNSRVGKSICTHSVLALPHPVTPEVVISVNSLVVVLAVQDAQNRHEQVQDIQVQRNGRSDLLLNMVMTHNQLRINENIRGENQRAQHTINKLERAVKRKEDSYQTEEDHEPQRTEQVRHPIREVVFGLAGEESQGDEDAQREDQGLHDDPCVVEGCHHADGVRF